jgi:two-component system sensor histidine kinase RegB
MNHLTSGLLAQPEAESLDRESSELSALTRSRNLMQLVHLRWMAIYGQVLTIALVHWGLGLTLPLAPMLSLLLVLVAVNIFNAERARSGAAIPDAEIFASILVDVAVLTGQLYLSGGGSNPFLHLYLLQVVLGAALLKPVYSWTLAALSSLCIALLNVWFMPLDFGNFGATEQRYLYAFGVVVCYAVNVVLLLNFGVRIARNNRLRDERLARLRQQAIEADHIMRTGLLASGAAHELGTPLATLSVILGDWQHLPVVTADAEMRDDLASMQQQLERCKKIVSGILLSAGQVRAESAEHMQLRSYLANLLAYWQQTRKPSDFSASLSEFDDQVIVANGVLSQMMDNVLDNALEAAANGAVRVTVWVENDALKFQVQDSGPGFAPEILRHLGQPYQSTKSRPGSGLGLFLSVNVARAYGGSITASNPQTGGALVLITLPLQSVRPT